MSTTQQKPLLVDNSPGFTYHQVYPDEDGKNIEGSNPRGQSWWSRNAPWLHRRNTGQTAGRRLRKVRSNKRRRGGQVQGYMYDRPSKIKAANAANKAANAAANAAATQERFDMEVNEKLLPGNNGSFSGTNPMHSGKGGKSRRRNKKYRSGKSKKRR